MHTLGPAEADEVLDRTAGVGARPGLAPALSPVGTKPNPKALARSTTKPHLDLG